MKIKSLILLCLLYQVLQTYGLVQLKNSLATSDSPLLMKILQLVDAATSNEHLLEVTLKLLRSLCVCMRETLKVKEENYLMNNSSVEPNESHITDGKVLDLYRNIYNNTCINLRQELTNRSQRYIAEEESSFLNHTSCGKDENNKTHLTTAETNKVLVEDNPLPSTLENILLKALIQTRHLHKYRIKKYNLLGKVAPNTKAALRHNLIVILTLHPDGQETPFRRHSITEEDLNKTLYTDSPIGIDIIDKKHDQRHKNDDNHKPDIVSDCNLQSLYIFLTESKRNNLTKVYKYMRKRETIKMYIEVNTSQNHSDYLNMCCYNGTSTPQCTHDAPIPSNMTNEKHNKTNLLRHYRNTITRIKKLVKLYENKLNDTKDLDIPVDSSGEDNKNTPNLESTKEDNTVKEDRASQKENDINKLVLNSNDTTQLAEVTKAIVLLNDFVSKQTTQHYLQTVEANQTNIDKAYTEPSINTEFENLDLLQSSGAHEYNSTKREVQDEEYNHTATNDEKLSHASKLTTYFKPNRTSNSEVFPKITAPMFLETEETTIALNLKETTMYINVNNNSTLDVSEAIDNNKQAIVVDVGEQTKYTNLINNTIATITDYNETIGIISSKINDQTTDASNIDITKEIIFNNTISINDEAVSYGESSHSTNMTTESTINDINEDIFDQEVTAITDYETMSVSPLDLNRITYDGAVIENATIENIDTITPERSSDDETIGYEKPLTVEDKINFFDVDVNENTTFANTSTITPEPASEYNIESISSTDLIDAKSSVYLIENKTTANMINKTMTPELGIDDKIEDFINTSADINSTEPSTADVIDKTTEFECDDKTMAPSPPLTLDQTTSKFSVSNITENTMTHEQDDDKTMGSSTLLTTDQSKSELAVTDIKENITEPFTITSEVTGDDETMNFTARPQSNLTVIESSMDDGVDKTVVVNTSYTTMTTELDSNVESSTAPSRTDINITQSFIAENTENTNQEDVFNFITASDDEIMDFALPLNTGIYYTPDSLVQNDDIFDKDFMLERKNYTHDTDTDSFTEDINTPLVTLNETQSVTYTSTPNFQAIYANKSIENSDSDAEVTENLKANINTNIDLSESTTLTPVFENIGGDLKNETKIQSATSSTIDSIQNILNSEDEIISTTPNASISLISEPTEKTKSTNNEYSTTEFNHEATPLKETTDTLSQEITTMSIVDKNIKIDLNTTFDEKSKKTVSIDDKIDRDTTMNTTSFDDVTDRSEPSTMKLGTIDNLTTNNGTINFDTENIVIDLNKIVFDPIITDAVPATLEKNQTTLDEEEINKTKDSFGVTSLPKTEDLIEHVSENVISSNTTDNFTAEDQTDRDQINKITESNVTDIDNQNATTNYSETTITTKESVVNYTDVTLLPDADIDKTTKIINNYTLPDVGEDTSLNVEAQVPSTISIPQKENTEPTFPTLKNEDNYELHSGEVKETVSTSANAEPDTEILHDAHIATDLTEKVESRTISSIHNLTMEIDTIQDTIHTENVAKVQFSPDLIDITTEEDLTKTNLQKSTKTSLFGDFMTTTERILLSELETEDFAGSSLNTSKENITSKSNLKPNETLDINITEAEAVTKETFPRGDIFEENLLPKESSTINNLLEVTTKISLGEETELTHQNNTINGNISASDITEKLDNDRISEDELSTTQKTDTNEVNLDSSDNNSTDNFLISTDLPPKLLWSDNQLSTANLSDQSFTTTPTLPLWTEDNFTFEETGFVTTENTLNIVETDEMLPTFKSETTNILESEAQDDFETYSPIIKKEDDTNVNEITSNGLTTTNSLDIEDSTGDLALDNSTIDRAEEAIITSVMATDASVAITLVNNITIEDDLVSQTPVYGTKEETTLTTEPESLNTEINTTISSDEEKSKISLSIKSTISGKTVDTDSGTFLLPPLLEESSENTLENTSMGTVTPELTTTQSFETSQSDMQRTTTEVKKIKDFDMNNLTKTSGLSDIDSKTLDNDKEPILGGTESATMQLEQDESMTTDNNTLSTMTQSEIGASTSNEIISYDITATTPITKLLSANGTESAEYETTKLPKHEMLPTTPRDVTINETSKRLKSSTKGKNTFKNPVAFELNIRVGVEANEDGIKFTVLGKKETAHNISSSRQYQQLFTKNNSSKITIPPIRSETIYKSEITLGTNKNQSNTSLNNQLKDIVRTNMRWNRKSNYDQQADLAHISTILNKITWNPLPTVNTNHTENVNNTNINNTQNAQQPEENITNNTPGVNFTTAYKNTTANNTSTTLSSNFTNVKHKSKMPGALTQTLAIKNIKSMYMKHLKKIKESMAFNKDENITAADVLSKIYDEMKLHPMGEIEIQNRLRLNMTKTNNITLNGNGDITNLNTNATMEFRTTNDTITIASQLKKKKNMKSKRSKVRAALKKLLKGKKLTKKQLRKLTKQILQKKFSKGLDKKIHGVKDKFNSTISNATVATSNKTIIQPGNVTKTQSVVNVTSLYVNNEATNITSLNLYNVDGNITNPFQNATRKSKENLILKEYKQQMKTLNKTGSYFLSGTRRKFDNSSGSNDTSQLNSSNINSTNQSTTKDEEKHELSEATEKDVETSTASVNTEDVTIIPTITKYEEILRVDKNNDSETQTTAFPLNDSQDNKSAIELVTKPTSFTSITIPDDDHCKNSTETTTKMLSIDIDKVDDLIYKLNGVNNNHSTSAYHDVNLVTTDQVNNITYNESSKYTVPMPADKSSASDTEVANKTEDFQKMPFRHFKLHAEIDLHDNVHQKDATKEPVSLQSDNNMKTPDNEPSEVEKPTDPNVASEIKDIDYNNFIKKAADESDRDMEVKNVILTSQAASEILSTTPTTDINIPTTVHADIAQQEDFRNTTLEKDVDDINYKKDNISNNENITTLSSDFNDPNVINTTDIANTMYSMDKVMTIQEDISTTTNNTLNAKDIKDNSLNSRKGLGIESGQNRRKGNIDTEDYLIEEVTEITTKTEETTLLSYNMDIKTITDSSSELTLTETTTQDNNVLSGTDSTKELKEEIEVNTDHEAFTTPYSNTFILKDENSKDENNSLEQLTSTTTTQIDKDLINSNKEVFDKTQTDHPTTEILYDKYLHNSIDLTTLPSHMTTTELNINLDQDQPSIINADTSTRVDDDAQKSTISMLEENITAQREDEADNHLYVPNKKDHEVSSPSESVVYVPTTQSLLLYGHQYNYRVTSEQPARLPNIYILDQDARQTVLNSSNENEYSLVKDVPSINKLIKNSETDSSSNMTSNVIEDIDNANLKHTQPYTETKSQKRFQIKSNNNKSRPIGTTNINTSSKTQYYNFKAHDNENISLNKPYNIDVNYTNQNGGQHYPVPFNEIRFRSEQTNPNDTVGHGYQNNNDQLSPSVHSKPDQGIKETRIEIYSTNVHRPQVSVTTSTPTTKSIKYNTYQPTTKEDLELLKYQDGITMDKTPVLNPSNPANNRPQQPPLNNSCAILRNISDKFSSKAEFMKILKAANCTKSEQIDLTNSYHQNQKAEEMNKNLRQPIEIIKIPHSSEMENNHHPILEININSPQIGTNGASPPMIEINGNPLPMEIHGHSLPLSVQGSPPQAINLATNLAPINQNLPYANSPNRNTGPMQTMHNPQPQNFYGNSPGIKMDRNSVPRLTYTNSMLVGMPKTPQNSGNLQATFNENNMAPPSNLQINKNLQQQNGLNRLTSPIISSDHKYFSDVNEQPFMSANIDNSAAISDNERYYVPVVNNNFNSPLQPKYAGGSPTSIENNWSPNLVSNSNRNPLSMMNTNMNPQLVSENNRNSPNMYQNSNLPLTADNGGWMTNVKKTSLPMAKDIRDKMHVINSQMFINSNNKLPSMTSNLQKTPSMTDDHNNQSPLNPTVDNTRKPQSVVDKNLNSELLLDKYRSPDSMKIPKTIDNSWKSRVMSNEHAPVVINNTQNVPTLTDNNKNSPLFDDKHLFTYIYSKNPSQDLGFNMQAPASKINAPTKATSNHKHLPTQINHPLYENARKAINNKLARNRENVITHPMIETNVISVPILETRKSGAAVNVPFVSINNVKKSLPISGKAHSSLEINTNARLNLITQNIKKLKSTSRSLLDPFEKKNPYPVKMLPVKSLKTPMQRVPSQRVKMGNRRMAVMTMNTQDFFSQHRFVTAKPPPLVYKPQRSGPDFSVLRPKFSNIDKASRRFGHRRQPVYMEPKDYVVEPMTNNVKWYKKVSVPHKAQQKVSKKMASVRRPTMRPSFVKSRVESIKSFMLPDEYKRITRRPKVLRVVEDSDSNDNYSPAAFYHRKRASDEEATTEAARTPRRRRTIFFLSPTVPYNQYG